MRQLLSCAAIVACAAATTACGPSTAATTRPTPDGEFRVLMPSPPTTLNPDLYLDEVAILIGRNIFNHLLSLNESGRLIPELAEAWQSSPDGLTYTFTLRAGIRWHDGTPFTSADVRWTFETVAKDGFGGRDALAPVAAIDTPDAATVVIRLKHPWAPFVSDLAGYGLAILPRHIYHAGDWRTNPANDRPIGTGPFKFAGWRDANTLVLEANREYFRSGPYVHRVVFQARPVDAIAETLIRGDADYSMVRPTSFDLKAPPHPIVAHTLPSSGRYYVALNLRRQPLSDVRVRRALASAVNQLEIVTKALGGLGAPAVGWYTPDVEWAYNSSARVPAHDLAEARRLLDAAGLPMKNGERLRLSMVVPNAPPIRDIGDLLREQFAAVGIAVDLERLPPADWPKRTLHERDFDLTIVTGGQGPDPDQLRRRFLASTDTGAYIGYDAPEFRDAVERGARAVSVAERAAAYYRAQEILARDVPIIPLAESIRVVVHNRRVSGLPQLEARGLVGAFDFSLVKLGAARPINSR